LTILCPLTLASCIKKAEVNAAAWLDSGLPPEYCEQHPEVRAYGKYRVLDGGHVEHLSYCTQVDIQKPDGTIEKVTAVQLYTSFLTSKVSEWLDILFPKQDAQ
jgi:hypothetical protein